MPGKKAGRKGGALWILDFGFGIWDFEFGIGLKYICHSRMLLAGGTLWVIQSNLEFGFWIWDWVRFGIWILDLGLGQIWNLGFWIWNFLGFGNYGFGIDLSYDGF